MCKDYYKVLQLVTITFGIGTSLRSVSGKEPVERNVSLCDKTKFEKPLGSSKKVTTRKRNIGIRNRKW